MTVHGNNKYFGMGMLISLVLLFVGVSDILLDAVPGIVLYLMVGGGNTIAVFGIVFPLLACIPILTEFVPELESGFLFIKHKKWVRKNIIEKVYEFYSKPYLVTIDAALSNRTRFGDIIVGSGFIKIGKALEKSICFYSDVTIKCVVGKCYIDKEKNLQELKRLSASKSNKIANDVSTSIKNVLEKTKIYA